MSVLVMGEVWKHSTCGGSELLTLLAMADYADEDGGTIFPSIATLAKKVRLSESQTRKIVRELRKDGHIELVKKGGAFKVGNRANEYRVRYPWQDASTVMDDKGGTIADDRGVLSQTIANTSYNHHKESSLSPDGVDNEKTSQRDMFGVVQKITGADAKLMASRIGKCAKQLIEAGYTIEMMQRFGKDVWQHDWRWQRSMARPTFAQLLAEVGKLKHGRIEMVPDEERRFYMSIDPNTGEKHYSEVPRD